MKKNFRSLLCLLLCVVLCLPMLLCACSGGPYRVTVVDALGNPYTGGVVVQFKQNGQTAGMQVIDENGVAEKDLDSGNYTVELSFTADAEGYYYDKTGLELTGSKKELTVTLAKAVTGEPETLVVNNEQAEAYNVDAACTYVKLTAGKRNYFLFTPTVAGTYEFSVPGSNAAIGYYGAPHYVQSTTAAEVVDNKFTISVSATMIGTGNSGTSSFVVGIDAGENTACTLSIQRTGDPKRTLEDEPWTIYKKTVELKEYKLPAGAQIKEFDLTAADYTLVLGSDGFYHLNTADGPLVLMRLGKKSQYLDDFKTILEHSGVTKYFFDENGGFVRKESYSECLLEYIEYMDEDNGVYPLTEDLKYIVQQRGEYSGWFDPDNSLYLFKDAAGNNIAGINPNNTWLFMCCYING